MMALGIKIPSNPSLAGADHLPIFDLLLFVGVPLRGLLETDAFTMYIVILEAFHSSNS